ncbi:MAG TPA: hypothetical protein VIU87_15020, partial [Mycobacterium sp.]
GRRRRIPQGAHHCTDPGVPDGTAGFRCRRCGGAGSATRAPPATNANIANTRSAAIAITARPACSCRPVRLLREAGLWTLQTSIFPENRPSLALHHSAGFRTVGVRERIGKLDGIWRDTVLLERRSEVLTPTDGT